MEFNTYFVIFFFIFLVRNIIEFGIKWGSRKEVIQGLPSLLVFIFSYVISVFFVLFYLYIDPPSDPWVFVFGVGLISFSYFFQVKSRIHLEDSYSPGIIPRGQLVFKGIYRIIRHPLYFFYCLEMASFMLIKSNMVSLLASLATIGAALVRIKKEEQLLAGKFGQQFQEYKAKTRKFIPFIY